MHSIIIVIAKYFILLPIFAVCYEFIRLSKLERTGFAVKVIAGGIISLILAVLASKLYHDPRPFVTGNFTPMIAHGRDNGFPSDHTLLAAFLGWTILGYSRKLGIATIGIAVLIGLARMAAGIHHSWDILGSIVISAIAAYAASKLYDYYISKRHVYSVNTSNDRR